MVTTITTPFSFLAAPKLTSAKPAKSASLLIKNGSLHTFLKSLSTRISNQSGLRFPE